MPSVIQVTLPSVANSIYISQTDNYTVPQVLGQVPYNQYAQDWQYVPPYQQKVLFSDNITLMFKTQVSHSTTGSPPVSILDVPKLYLCDHNKNIISAINLNVAPYFKGWQEISGDNFVNPFDGTTVPLLTTCWSFSFNAFSSTITAGGIYYLLLQNQDGDGGAANVISYYSEPIFLSNTWPDTLLFQYSYNSNNALKNIVTGGWFNDFGSGFTSPYLPVFNCRIEGYINELKPKGINIGYLQQSYDQIQIKALKKAVWTVKLGEISLGIPYYLLEIAAEALMADQVWINNYSYIIFNPSAQSSLTDLFKIKDSDINSLIYAQIDVMERYPQQRAMVTPQPSYPSRYHDSTHDSTYD